MHDALRLEIQELARAQIRPRFESLSAPLLDNILEKGACQGRLDLLDKAILTIPEDATRQTAQILFGSSDDRWEMALGARRKLAGRTIGFNPETFRRKGPDGFSDYDRLAEAVASALFELARPTTTAGEVEGEERTERVAVSEALDRETGWTGARWIAGAVVGVLVIAGLTLLFFSRGSGSNSDADTTGPEAEASSSDDQVLEETSETALEEPEPTASFPQPRLVAPPVEGCDIPVAAALNPAAIATKVVKAMIAAFDSAGGAPRLGCPRHTAEEFSGVWLQQLVGGDGVPEGSLVATERGAFWAEQGVVEGYRWVLGGTLPEIAGVPTAYSVVAGHPMLQLERGGVIVGHDGGGPAFWVPTEGQEAWGGPDGELGLPMTDVNYIGGILTQEYERGTLRLVADDEVERTLASDSEVASVMAAISTDRPGIAGTFDGTAWWITDDGDRRWIPSGDVWFCLGGEDVVIANDLPGWAIAMRYELGEKMECPED